MVRVVSMLVVVVILLVCCSVAFSEVLVAAAEPAADGQRAVFKVVNVSKPVCLAVFQANDAGSLLTLTTYYLKTLQTIQAAPPMVLHYKTTAFFALFEPVGGTNTACMTIPTSFLSDPNRAPAIYETLAGGDGPPVTIVQLAGALNVAQQNCSAIGGGIYNSSGVGGTGGVGGSGIGGSGTGGPGGMGAGGPANASGGAATGGDAITSGGNATGGTATANGGTATGGNGTGGNGGAGYGGNGVGGTGGTGGSGLSTNVSGNCTGSASNAQNNSILQNASAIVTFGFEEINFRAAEDTALTSALVNCSAPSIQTSGSSMTVSCKLPTTGGTFSTQTFH